MSGGAWPFLVGGVICLVNSDNERDLNLLTRDGGRLSTGSGDLLAAFGSSPVVNRCLGRATYLLLRGTASIQGAEV